MSKYLDLSNEEESMKEQDAYSRHMEDLEEREREEKTMTKQEAIEAMKQGKKVRHKYFTDDEWMKTNHTGTVYILEDGVECSAQEFWKWRIADYWNDGYDIVQ